jgi:hypothetical protein
MMRGAVPRWLAAMLTISTLAAPVVTVVCALECATPLVTAEDTSSEGHQSGCHADSNGTATVFDQSSSPRETCRVFRTADAVSTRVAPPILDCTEQVATVQLRAWTPTSGSSVNYHWARLRRIQPPPGALLPLRI